MRVCVGARVGCKQSFVWYDETYHCSGEQGPGLRYSQWKDIYSFMAQNRHL
jgi:hypothetical protein